jgi:lysyl-tRNA synthetase class 1
MSEINTGHWADIYAEKVIREKGPKEQYVCASGITPSGTVHIGNFREIISVDLVVRALRDRGKKVRFIYSWDDYDVYRKVPKNMPNQELLATYLRQPITLVPDTTGRAENYARANELEVEKTLPKVGIFPEYIYQAQRYQSGAYANQIRHALAHKAEIKATLDAHRTEPLPEDWMPVSIFCTQCHRDTTTVLSWDGEWGLSYSCESCGNNETVDLRTTPAVKLPWRVDWPMRWVYEGVDFEPAGKDHHSEGGSFDTARETVKIFGGQAPVTFQYDFISIKGRGGKISSSSGEVISLPDVLEIYTPELTRYLFASTRPNAEFAISFDLDVLKIYEDYDKCERIYYGVQEVNEKEKSKQRRIYELSQRDKPEPQMPYQAGIRQLTNLLQTYMGDVERTLRALPDVRAEQVPRLRERIQCAWNWVTNHAPADFKFSLRTQATAKEVVADSFYPALKELHRHVLEDWNQLDERGWQNLIYEVARQHNLDPRHLFQAIYQVLISKDEGPRLGHFFTIIGQADLLKLLEPWS